VAKMKSGVRHKKRENADAAVRDAGVYHGKQAKTGNSLGLRRVKPTDNTEKKHRASRVLVTESK
jgi:hypothetical protein